MNLKDQIESLKKQKDNAYWERNQLVAVLSRLFPSYLTKHPETDQNWDDDWRTIVVINIPVITRDCTGRKIDYTETKQLTWHIHDSEVTLFDHLIYQDNEWDGHNTEEKYRRLRLIDLNKARKLLINYLENVNND